MNEVSTILPISLDLLKQYFSNNELKFKIDYTNSNLKKDKALIYLSNLELPCDIIFDNKNDDHLDLLIEYIKCRYIVNLPSLEIEYLKVLMEYKGIEKFGYEKFVEKYKDELDKVNQVLESLVLFNFYCVNSKKFKEDVDTHEKISTADIGFNFVNLLKYEEFFLYYERRTEKNLKFYEDIFTEYIFKGKNLFHYWANNKNPIFLITFGISQGLKMNFSKEDKNDT